MAKTKIDTVCTENIGKPKEEKMKILRRGVAALQKRFNREDAIFFGKDNPGYGIYERIPFGVLPIDKITGGGAPRGLFTHVFGPRGGGKTTLCFYLIANCQRTGGVAAYIDAEHRGNADWARTCGVDLDELLVLQPQTAEEGLEGLNNLAKSSAVDLIVLDSIVALATVAESTRELTDESIALLARKLSQFFRLSTHNVSSSKTAVVFINQIRTDINSYGAPENAPGGNALRHYISLSIKVRRGSVSAPEWDRFKEDNKPVGYPMFMKIDKSSIGKPNQEVYADFYEGSGIDPVGTMLNMAIDSGVIQKGAAGFYTYIAKDSTEHRLRGRDNFLELVETNDTLRSEIESRLLSDKEIDTNTAAENNETEVVS